MKKWLLILMTILLASCSKPEADIATNSTVQQSETNVLADGTLSHEQALKTAETVIDETLAIFDDVYDYAEEKNFTDDELLEALQPARTYATAPFIERYLFQPGYSCTDSYCPLPEHAFFSLTRGFRPTVEKLTAEQLQISALYPSFRLREYEDSAERTPDMIQSQKYTFMFIQEDETWKLNDIQLIDADMNITEQEVADYVKKHNFDFQTIVATETRDLLGQQERIYRFQEQGADYTYELVARTGFLSSSAGLDYDRYDLSYLDDELFTEGLLTEQQADRIVTSLIDVLKNETMQAADNDLTITAADLRTLWANYATDNFIEQAFASVEDTDECYLEYCHVLYHVPHSFNLGWDKQFSIAEQAFTATSLFPNLNDTLIHFSQFVEIDVVFVNGEWKIDHIAFTEQDIDLQEQDVRPFLQSVYGITVDDFYKGTIYVEDVRETVYIFADPESSNSLYLFARTGVMHSSDWYDE